MCQVGLTRRSVLALCVAALASPRLAIPATSATPAGNPPKTRKFRYSPYEEATIGGALDRLGLVLDDHPEGKRVERIEVVRLEVIEERDPAPRILNVFHVETRDYVIRREVLLRPGEAYSETLADETRRNLAALSQLSLVLVVAARGSAPDQIRLVIVTKDVWSLRLNWNVALTGAGVDGLSLNPSETNFLGTQQTLGLLVTVLPLSQSYGAQYIVPRLMGSRIRLYADAGLIVNASTGVREGAFGNVEASSPLWSSLTEWSWGASANWLDEVTRLYSNGKLASFTIDSQGAPHDVPQASCPQTSIKCVPWAYSSEVSDVRAFVTRSFGWAVKHDFTIGFEGRQSRYRVPGLSSFDTVSVQAFQKDRLPLSEERVGPFIQYDTYSTSFLRVLDLETLALQEEYRLGPQGHLQVYPVLRLMGASRTYIGIAAGSSYAGSWNDGLARVSIDTSTEIDANSGNVEDGSVRTSLRVASPRLHVGRIVLDAAFVERYANARNLLSYLGGDTRLRGYPSQYFVGADFAGLNLEYRSRPWQVLGSLQLGGVAFYDVGDAFDGWRNLRLWQSAGIGARSLFPQLDRTVFRVDVGFPLSRPLPQGVSRAAVYATFGQAFSP